MFLRQLKKFLSVFLVSMTACSLFACGGPDHSSSSTQETITSEETQNVPSIPGEEAVPLSLVTDPYGGIFRSGTGTENGYYETMSMQPEFINILYTDYKTRTRTYLCSDPECLHNDDTCTSYFPAMGACYLFSDSTQNKVYLVAAGVATDGTDSDPAAVNGRIFVFEPNGANRRVLYQHQSNEQFSGTAASDGSELYTGVQVLDQDTAKMTLEIREIDLETGESKTIYATESSGERIFGAYEDCLVLETVDETSRNYCSINVRSGQKSEVQYSYPYVDDVRTEFVDGKYVYSLRPEEDPYTSLYRIDLMSGEEEKIAEKIEIYDEDSTRISGVFDNHVEIETSDHRNVDAVKLIKYIVDLDSGECIPSSLQYDALGVTKNIAILAESGDSFLTRNGVKKQTVTVTDNTGVPNTLEAAFPQYALIAKNDYWKNVDQYQSIHDSF